MARFDPVENRFVALPIDLGMADEQVHLILFGTGIRFRGGLSIVEVRVGEMSLPVNFASSQDEHTELDQISLLLPHSLAGKGEVNWRC